MSEPIVVEDIELHFTSGDPLYLTDWVSGRDTITITPERITAERHPEHGVDEIYCVPVVNKLNYWKVTRRTVAPEPTDAMGGKLEI